MARHGQSSNHFGENVQTHKFLSSEWYKNSTFHWILGTLLFVGSNCFTYNLASKSDTREEQQMRESQMGWFDVIGSIIMVDTVHFHPEQYVITEEKSGQNLNETIVTAEIGHVPAHININLLNRGNEAAKIAFCVGKAPLESRKRILWDAFLGKDVDERIAITNEITIKEGPIIQPHESTIVNIPLYISDTDSSGKARAQVAILAKSVPHERFALTYLWLDINDRNRRPGVHLECDATGTLSTTIFKCDASIIRRDFDLLDKHSENTFLDKMEQIQSDKETMKRAELRSRLP